MSDDGRYLITGSGCQSIMVFDVRTGQQLHHYTKTHNGIIYYIIIIMLTNVLIEGLMAVTMSIDNQRIFTGSKGGSIKVLKLEENQQVHQITNIHNSTNIMLSRIIIHF